MKIQELAQIQVTSKALISSNIDAIVQAIENGEADALEMQALAGILAEASKQLKSATTKFAVNEAEAYGKGEVITYLGCTLTKGSSTRYKYQGAYYEELKAHEEELKKSIKEYEQQAQLLTKNNKAIGYIGDAETGEQIEVLPAIASTTEMIKVTIPKA